MNIVWFDTKGWEKKPALALLKKHKITFIAQPLTKKSASKAKNADAIAVFVSSSVGKEVLDQLPKLKLIATRSTGFDNVDLEECKKRNIKVCNVPAYGDNTVAEYTFALLLSLIRKIPSTIQRIKMGHFDREGLQGLDLKGKKIGIIGLGKIGQNVAKIAHGFDMNIIAFDIHQDKDLAKRYDITYKPLDKIFKEADILTFHVPLNPHTVHLLNKESVKTLKKGCLVLNTSRGPVLDTDALLYGLRKKIIGGLAIDVLENEALLENPFALNEDAKGLKQIAEEHILTELDNVLVTPHNAFNTKEAVMRILNTTCENLNAYPKCKNKVN